jgi:hypothetical protein
MSTTDSLLENNEAYAGVFDKGDLPLPPARKVAVLRAWTPASTRRACSAWRRATPT